MVSLTLADFIRTNREELARRCRAKVSTPPAASTVDGIPRFLDDLAVELSDGQSQKRLMDARARGHGAALFFDGSNIAQVVREYGAVCQSVTDLAVEKVAAISAAEFRALNLCLDDAIASAVSEFSHQERRDGEDGDLRRELTVRNLVESALIGFEALQAGTIGAGGATSRVVHESLLALRDRCKG